MRSKTTISLALIFAFQDKRMFHISWDFDDLITFQNHYHEMDLGPPTICLVKWLVPKIIVSDLFSIGELALNFASKLGPTGANKGVIFYFLFGSFRNAPLVQS